MATAERFHGCLGGPSRYSWKWLAVQDGPAISSPQALSDWTNDKTSFSLTTEWSGTGLRSQRICLRTLSWWWSLVKHSCGMARPFYLMRIVFRCLMDWSFPKLLAGSPFFTSWTVSAQFPMLSEMKEINTWSMGEEFTFWITNLTWMGTAWQPWSSYELAIGKFDRRSWMIPNLRSLHATWGEIFGGKD